MRRDSLHIAFLLLIIATAYSCINNDKEVNKYSSDNSSTKSKPQYIDYSDSGFVKKYYDEDWNLVHYKNKAAYYREAYYINGEPDPDKIVKDYYINGQIQFKGHILSENPDVLVGKIKWYYRNGKIRSIENYEDGKLNGQYSKYYESGNIKIKTNFSDGNLNGILYEYYNKPHRLKKKCYYTDGTLNGDYISYHKNGKKQIKANFEDGLKEGWVIKYHKNGRIKEKIKYEKGKINGIFISYYPNGAKKVVGHYSGGEETGTWYYYDKDGDYKKYRYITYRIGAVCNDGTRSNATGRGTCSWHGGVNYWLTKKKKKFILGTGKYSNYHPKSLNDILII
jgi:antitoxin component YwqK of YwqJK toxin-antitoxin module